MYNIPTQLLNWYNSFLCNRTLNCKINDTLSDSFSLNTGIPQGSGSSSPLWNIYSNDVPDFILFSNILMFPDVDKIFKVIHNSDDSLFL